MSFAFLEWAREDEGLTEESDEVFDTTDEVINSLNSCLPEGFYINYSDDGILLFYGE